MVPYLHLKAKVVRRGLPFLFLIVGYQVALSQVLNQAQKESISVNFQQVPLGEIVNHISRLSGLNFIYSSNKIDVRQLVSLRVTNQSVERVLEKLGEVAQLTFKQHNQYVVIKSGLLSHQPQFFSAAANKQSALPDFDSSAWRNSLLERVRSYRTLNQPSATEVMLAKYLPTLTTSFNAEQLRNIPAKYIDAMHKQRQHKNWFVSVGSIINEYSAGAEFQIGYRSVCAVGNLTMLNEAELLPGFGIGTSFVVNRNFSFNPAYVYNFRNYQEPLTKYDKASIDVKSRIHRLKLMVQYTRIKKVGLRAGITFNQIVNEFTFPEPPRIEVATSSASGFTAGYQIPKSGLPPTQRYSHYSNGIFTSQMGPTKTFRTWIGWEAGISYRINLFH